MILVCCCSVLPSTGSLAASPPAGSVITVVGTGPLDPHEAELASETPMEGFLVVARDDGALLVGATQWHLT
jgi:hypothetical protein